MTVGLVIVSHSSRLAEGVVELAGQMAQGKVQLAAAGGAENNIIGTSADKIQAAIQTVDAPDGILILLDLGSAILSAEMALEFLDDDQRARIVLSYAPLVEGAIAAAIEASLGHSLLQVKQAAENTAHPEQLRKLKPISETAEEKPPADIPTLPQTVETTTSHRKSIEQPIDTPSLPAEAAPSVVEVQLAITNAAGLHARPASQFVQAATRFQANIQVQAHGKQTSAKSILNVLSLGVRQGDTITLRADGSDARAAIDALSQLIESDFKGNAP